MLPVQGDFFTFWDTLHKAHYNHYNYTTYFCLRSVIVCFTNLKVSFIAGRGWKTEGSFNENACVYKAALEVTSCEPSFMVRPCATTAVVRHEC